MGRLVANTMLPLVPAQVVGLVAVPATKVGVGFVKVFVVEALPVQPLLVMEKLL